MDDKVRLSLEINPDKTREWIKAHRDAKIMDTPLWVLINLGAMTLEEDAE